MEGEPIAKATLTSAINLSNGGNTVFAPNVNLENFSAKFEGNFIPLKDETLEMNLAFDDCVRLIIDNDTVYEYWKPRARVTKGTKTMNFKAGKSYKFQIDYLQNTDMAVMNFDIVKRQQTNEQEILKAVANAEVVIFAGGISSYLEGEEMISTSAARYYRIAEKGGKTSGACELLGKRNGLATRNRECGGDPAGMVPWRTRWKGCS